MPRFFCAAKGFTRDFYRGAIWKIFAACLSDGLQLPGKQRNKCATSTPWSGLPILIRRSTSTASSSGLGEAFRIESNQGRFTLVYLAAPGDQGRATSRKKRH